MEKVLCGAPGSALAEIEIDAGAGRTVTVTVSAGAAIYPRDADTYETLLADADARMYRDKAARRVGTRLSGGVGFTDLTAMERVEGQPSALSHQP